MAQAADIESSRFPWWVLERPARLFSMADGQEGANTALAATLDVPMPCWWWWCWWCRDLQEGFLVIDFSAVALLLSPPGPAVFDPGDWSALNLTLGDLESSATGLAPPPLPLWLILVGGAVLFKETGRAGSLPLRGNPAFPIEPLLEDPFVPTSGLSFVAWRPEEDTLITVSSAGVPSHGQMFSSWGRFLKQIVI